MEYARVLRGAKLVVDSVVRRSQPGAQHKMERAIYHISELVQLAQEVLADRAKDRPEPPGNEAGHAQADRSSRSGGLNEQNDPIGFDKIKEHEQPMGVDTQAMHASQMRERSVPSTPVARMVGFGGLALRLAMGEAMDRANHALSGASGPRTISDESADRLAESLCRMRGAALKLGQMLSIQDESSLPPSLARALDRVKQAADYMPQKQLEQQLSSQLGADWRSKFLEFNPVPIAAASIGQVHRATLHDNTPVAVKIQYPGVAESIESDLDNLKRLVKLTGILPPGLFIDNIISVARTELAEECKAFLPMSSNNDSSCGFLFRSFLSLLSFSKSNGIYPCLALPFSLSHALVDFAILLDSTGDYLQEASNQMQYREHILNDAILHKYSNVPEVIPGLSTARVLTSKLVAGVSIDKAAMYSQPVRNAIARTVLLITIRELFNWRFIQSDPNFANFLYDDASHTIHLIDFGAARRYSKKFVDGYMRLVWAAANRDREGILAVSRELGFLTGDETQEFVDAHVDAGMVVGEPFLKAAAFDFANSQLTTRISKYGGTFMKYRLTPPPTEAYSLHRKLAGAFLLCIKLRASIPCRDMLEDVYRDYKFD